MPIHKTFPKGLHTWYEKADMTNNLLEIKNSLTIILISTSSVVLSELELKKKKLKFPFLYKYFIYLARKCQ